MKRSRIRARRATPRTRVAPRWSPEEWDEANVALGLRSLARCECCGSPLNGTAERHHRQRRRDGGDRLSNLLLLLPDHHRYWTEHPMAARDRGLIVSSHTPDPSAVPVFWHGIFWVYLEDDGSRRPAPAKILADPLDKPG